MILLTASALIIKLQEAINEHGDKYIVLEDPDTAWLLAFTDIIYLSKPSGKFMVLTPEFTRVIDEGNDIYEGKI